MKYFSLFSGIGGFEHGIQTAFAKRHSPNDQNDKHSIQPKSNISRSFEHGNKKTFQLQQECEIRSDKNHLRHNGNKPNTNSGNGNGRWDNSLCIGFSEIDKYAIQIYKKHFPTHKEYGDVTNIKWSDVPNFELLCGGFPCQSFSIAGKRGGFLDTRGTLFFQIARAAQEKQPRLLLLENVKGLLSHDKGRTFGTILNTLDEIGYDLQWQVLNSKNFGVPQNRERVFIIGHLRTTPRPEVFPLRQTNKIHPENNNRKIAKCLDSNYSKGWLDHGQRTMLTEMKVANTVTPDAYLATGKRKRVNGKAVLTSMHERRIRRLTPTECERLQGFPDGWTEKGIDIKGIETSISDTQRYHCLGNAVTTYVIEAIVEKLIKYLTSSADCVKLE